jgi:hypothetical protein
LTWWKKKKYATEDVFLKELLSEKVCVESERERG